MSMLREMQDLWQEETIEWEHSEREALLEEKGKDFIEGVENKMEGLFQKVERGQK